MYESISKFLNDQTMTIVSVYPMEFRKVCRLGTLNAEGKMGGITEYVVPKAPKGGFSKLVVHGATDMGIDRSSEPEQPLPRPVPVDSVVEDLMRMFTTDGIKTSASEGPGVFVADQPNPTDEEILKSPKYAAALARQEAYFRTLIYDGDQLTAKGQPVTNLHRVAAIYMGTEDRPWVKEITERRTKRCPACAEVILAAALKCQHCNTDLVAWALDNGVTKEEDPVVWQRVQTRKAKPAPLKPVAA